MPVTVLLSFLLFTGLVAGLTWFLTHKDDHSTSDGFFLAGRRLGAIVIAGSLLLTNLSTEQLVGLNGDAYKGGLHVMVWEIVTVLAIVLMALFFLPRFLRSGVTTVPQFLDDRFGPTTRTITTLVFLIAYAVVLLPMILYTGAQALSQMFDVKTLTGIENPKIVLWLAVWLIGLIGSVYALFGGLRTVAVSDTLNGVGLLLGGVLITYFGLQAVGGDNGVMAGLDTIRADQADRLNSIGGSTDLVPFETVFTGAFLLMTFYWCTNQQIIQRTFAARDLKTGQKGVLLCGAVKLLGPIYLVLPGLIAYQLFFNNPEHAGLEPAQSYGRLVREVLPAGLVGFFAAVVVGAILSSFNSALNSATTLFSLGVYKPIVNKDASEKQVVASGKWFGWTTAAVAMTIAPLLAGQDSIFGFLQMMNAIYFIPILSVVVVGMLTRRVPGWSANTALILGVALLLVGNFVPVGESEEGKALLLAGGVMHNFHFVGIVFVLLVALMLIAQWIKPRPEVWVHEHSKDVDITPWKFAWPAGIVLVIAVIVIYAVFADFTVLSPNG
ncbi:MAG: solute:sodium symporter family transporter [Planctomycetota bacterium]